MHSPPCYCSANRHRPLSHLRIPPPVILRAKGHVPPPCRSFTSSWDSLLVARLKRKVRRIRRVLTHSTTSRLTARDISARFRREFGRFAARVKTSPCDRKYRQIAKRTRCYLLTTSQILFLPLRSSLSTVEQIEFNRGYIPHTRVV